MLPVYVKELETRKNRGVYSEERTFLPDGIERTNNWESLGYTAKEV